MPVRRGCVSLGAHRLARLHRVATLCTAGRFITGKFDGIRSKPDEALLWIEGSYLLTTAHGISPLMDKAHARGVDFSVAVSRSVAS